MIALVSAVRRLACLAALVVCAPWLISASRAEAAILYVAAATGAGGGFVQRFDTTTDTLLDTFVSTPATFGGNPWSGSPNSFTFGPDGRFYTSNFRNGTLPNPLGEVVVYSGNDGPAPRPFQGQFTTGATMQRTTGIVFHPNGFLYVADSDNDRVYRFDAATGVWDSSFVANGGGLDRPSSIAIHSSGDLLVASGNTSNVLRYSAADGSFVSEFTNGIASPSALVLGPDGDLYIASAGFSTNAVYTTDGVAGGASTVFTTGAPNGVSTGLAFGPDNDLYVSSFVSGQVLEFNATTGAFVGTFASGFNSPQFLAFGPAPIPEPTTVGLACAGLAVLAVWGRRRQSC